MSFVKYLCFKTTSLAFAMAISFYFGSAEAGEEPPTFTSVKFVDACTGEEIETSSPNGVVLELEIQGLKSDRPVRLDLKMGQVDELGVRGESRWKYDRETKKVPKNGRLFFRKKMQLRHLGRWSALVTWMQGQTEGSGVASLMQEDPKLKKRIFVDKTTKCTLVGPIQLHSDFVFNNSDGIMKVGTSTIQSLDRQWIKGLESDGGSAVDSLGATGGNRGSGKGAYPGQSNFIGISGWLSFTDEKSIESKSELEIGRSWLLQPGRVGVSAHRQVFTRYSAKEFDLIKDPGTGCYRWEAGREGVLEVGRNSSSFYDIPRDLLGNQEATLEFIEKMLPLKNSCQEFREEQSIREIQFQDHDQIVIFYPES